MFRSVNNRCFVDFEKIKLKLSTLETIKLLQTRGFEVIDIDLISEARALVNKPGFRLGARMSEAPKVFDCSSFIKWLFGQKGIQIPRLAVQQFEFGTPVELEKIEVGDLVFTSGYCKNAWHIGHVGLYTGGSVITAMIQKPQSGVIEIPLETLLTKRIFRGVRRIFQASSNTRTLIIPREYEIETSDDIRYLVLSLTSSQEV